MATIVLDTGVIIAVLDRDDVHASAVHSALVPIREAGASFCLSVVTFAELLVESSGAQPNAEQVVGAFVDSLGTDAIQPVSAEVARIAAKIRTGNRRVRMPDALIAATAETIGAEALLTTDKKLAKLPRARYIGERSRH